MDQSVGSRLDIAVTAGGTVAAAMIAAVLWFGLSWTDAFGAIPVWISAAYALFGALLLAAHRPSRAAMLVAAAISLTVSVIVDPILSLRPLLVLTAVVLPVVGATMVREWWRMAALFTGVVVLVEVFGSAQDTVTRVVEGIGILAVMWLSVWLVWRLSHAVGAVTARSDTLFERSPVPTWEIDFSEVARTLSRMRSAGVNPESLFASDTKRLEAMAMQVRVRRANPAALKLFGLPKPEHPLIYHGLVTRNESLAMLRDEILAIWTGSGGFERETSSPQRDGTPVWLRLSWTPTTTPEGYDYASVIVAAADVTPQKQAAELLEDQVKQKDRFIAAISHELRTPLAVVVGLAQELRDRPLQFTPDETSELVDLIASQSMDVAHIVEDLLVAARIDTGNITVIPEDVALEPALASVVPGDVPCTVEPDLIARADPYRLRQIVRNLINNAVRYGGSNRRVSAVQHDGAVQIDVGDDGPGIPQPMVEVVFEPYGRASTESPSRMSVGLGLTVSRELAELMGGTLEYLREGGFTVFRLRLPLGGGLATGAVGGDRGGKRTVGGSRNSLDPTQPRPIS